MSVELTELSVASLSTDSERFMRLLERQMPDFLNCLEAEYTVFKGYICEHHIITLSEIEMIEHSYITSRDRIMNLLQLVAKKDGGPRNIIDFLKNNGHADRAAWITKHMESDRAGEQSVSNIVLPFAELETSGQTHETCTKAFVNVPVWKPIGWRVANVVKMKLLTNQPSFIKFCFTLMLGIRVWAFGLFMFLCAVCLNTYIEEHNVVDNKSLEYGMKIWILLDYKATLSSLYLSLLFALFCLYAGDFILFSFLTNRQDATDHSVTLPNEMQAVYFSTAVAQSGLISFISFILIYLRSLTIVTIIAHEVNATQFSIIKTQSGGEGVMCPLIISFTILLLNGWLTLSLIRSRLVSNFLLKLKIVAKEGDFKVYLGDIVMCFLYVSLNIVTSTFFQPFNSPFEPLVGNIILIGFLANFFVFMGLYITEFASIGLSSVGFVALFCFIPHLNNFICNKPLGFPCYFFGPFLFSFGNKQMVKKTMICMALFWFRTIYVIIYIIDLLNVNNNAYVNTALILFSIVQFVASCFHASRVIIEIARQPVQVFWSSYILFCMFSVVLCGLFGISYVKFNTFMDTKISFVYVFVYWCATMVAPGLTLYIIARNTRYKKAPFVPLFMLHVIYFALTIGFTSHPNAFMSITLKS